jgi:nitroreductase
MSSWLETLLGAAIRAPSGDNTQPWRFVVEGDTVALGLDPERDTSPMNAGQRMSRIAVGAALENLVRAARAIGLSAELAADPSPHLAKVILKGETTDARSLDSNFGARATNRRAYDGRTVSPQVIDRLAAASPDVEGVASLWIVGSERLTSLAELIGRADALMFGDPSMRRAFLNNVRFDRPAAEAVDEGLSLGSLELSFADRMALRVMKHAPAALLKIGGASAVFNAKARELIVSSSGLLVVAAADDSESTDVRVGRAVQSAWLALTAEGLAAQPMMSIPVLENALRHGDPDLREALGVASVSAVIDPFRSSLPEMNGRRPAWLMRFGFAPPPTGRTGRLPLARVSSYE